MDEILIEEKRYISSKRAAKVTGYAKDYIGQLCREGRVPARLVGRNWYVLETAIHDHRFGQQAITPARDTEASISHQTWESPQYEASPVGEFPQIIPEQHSDVDSVSADEQDLDKASRHLQDSWREWFDRVADAVPAIPDIIPEKPVEKEEEKEVHIPIRAIHHSPYQPPPEELLPKALTQEASHHRTETRPVSESREESAAQMLGRIGVKAAVAIQIAGVLFALVMVALAIIDSGYVDKYILSSKRASLISGVILYNRYYSY